MKEVLNLSYEKVDDKTYEGTDLALLNLINAIVAISKKINELTNIVDNLWQYELNEYKTNKQITMLGNKGSGALRK